MTTNGVIYIAYGAKYAAEAARSAASIKKLMPDLPITLFTQSNVSDAVFDNVVQVQAQPYHRTHKPGNMARTPYERSLYLDTDTYVCGDIRPLFALLDRFDLAAAHDPNHIKLLELEILGDAVEPIPLSFAQFNGGVILYKQSQATTQLFAEWVRVIERNDELCKARGRARVSDQTPLREVLYKSNLRVATLTPEYNCRARGVGFLDGEAKILHGRHFDYARTTASLNQSSQSRIFVNFPEGAQLLTKRQVINSTLGKVGRLRLRLAALLLNFCGGADLTL